jgi:alpha-beta hydrolase superfamily lysophospholipase
MNEGHFTGHGGLRLFFRSWLPANGRPPRVTVVNIHGLGDHSGLYSELAERLVSLGAAVFALDLRGHGRSPGQRAYLDSWADYRDDLDAFVAMVRSGQPGVPIVLLGHSLGGLIAIEYALHHPAGLAGVIAAAPPLGAVGVPPVLMALGRLFSRVWPRFSLSASMDLGGLSRDPEVVRTILTDPLFHRQGTARLSTEVVAAIARVHELAPGLRVPLLILHGSADRMVPPAGSRALAARLTGCTCAALREYPGAYHCLFFDDDREKVLHDVERWLENVTGDVEPGAAPALPL